MKTETKKISMLAMLLMSVLTLFGCSNDPYDDGINWNGDNGGTLEIFNGSSRDIIVFVGQTPSPSSMLGGIRAGATKKFDPSKHVDDYDVGGYTILRGVTKEQYEANKLDLTKAKVEFNTMATYRRGTTYRIQIDGNYMGDNGFRVMNTGRVGIELRKDSPEGEKVAYLPALQQNLIVYTQTTESITLFPVYVFYNKTTGEVSTLKSTSMFESITVGPRSLTEPSIPTIYFPNDETDAWEKIVGTLKSPSAYISVTNNVSGQAVYFTIGGSNRLLSQSGYDVINNESLMFEVPSSEEGTEKALIIMVYGMKIPVLFEGQTDLPVIKNGYNYEVTIKGSGSEASGYTARIVDKGERNLQKEILENIIESL
jgi:hypothetical protein